MANIQRTLINPLYRNWVKGGLVLKVTRDGIQCFVGDTVTNFLQKSLNDISARKHLPIGTVCNSCTTQNVLRCPTRGTCTIRHGACKFHDNSDPSKTYRPCPAGICDELQDIIYRNHRFHGPSWRNTNAQLWCNNSWEIAKCFMAADGYITVASAADTDFPGLVSVVINLIDFQNVVADNLSQTNSIFCQARRIRNEILHTSTSQLSVSDLDGYIDTMIQLLNDPKHLATNGNAQAAITKLNQIKNNSLAVTQEDECQLREEALKAIKDKREEALQELQTKGKGITDDIEVKGCQQVTLIQDKAEEKKTEVMQNLETREDEIIDDIEAKGCQQITLIQDKADEKREEIIQNIETTEDKIIDNTEAKGCQQITLIQDKADEKRAEIIQNIETREDEIIDNIEAKGCQQITLIQDKADEKRAEIIQNIDTREDDIIDDIEAKGCQQITLIQDKADEKRAEIIQNIETREDEIIDGIETKGCQQVTLIHDKAVEKKAEVIQNLETTEKEILDNIDAMGCQQVTLIQEVTEEKKTEVIQSMETREGEIKDYMEAKKEEVLQDIGAVSTHYVKVFQKEADEKKEKMIQDLEVKNMKLIEDLKVADIQQKEKQSYTDEKENLQSELINLYREHYIKASVYTQRTEEEDIGINDIYVEPNMEVVGLQQELHGNTTGKTSVKSYKDIFYKDSRVSKNIYITGKAGMGKTAFCKRLLSTWCRAHSKHKTNFEHPMLPTSIIRDTILPNDDKGPGTSADKEIRNMHAANSDQTSLEDEQVMLNFPFLFYISLRSAGDDSALENMIKKQLLIDEMHQKLLNKILQKEPEKCLIVLDGLDEWSPPSNHRQDLPYVTTGLPARTAASKCTILTTTRPWKLEVLKLRPPEINQHVALLGLDAEAAEQMMIYVIKILNGRSGQNKCDKMFRIELCRRNLSGLVIVPVILKQLICLWHADKLVGNSQCDIYGGMLSLMFELAETKHEENVEVEHQDAQHRLPRCFGNLQQCQEFTPLITSLGRLSFESLMSRNEESALVFDSSVAEMYGLSAETTDSCLKVGILSQNKVYSNNITRQKSLSFIHKSFQEFLAAVFVSMTYDSSATHLLETIFSKMNSLENVFVLGVFLVFVSGMIPQIVYKISEHICEVTSSVTKDYIQNISRFNNGSCPIYKLNGLMTICVKESRDNGCTDIQLKLEDIIINMNTVLFPGMLPETDAIIDLFKLNEIPIYIMHMNIKNIKSINIDLSLLSSKNIESLCQSKALKAILVANDGIKNTNETCHGAASSLIMNSKDTLLSLSLSKVSELPILSDLKCLQSLEIAECILSTKNINCLMEYINGTTQLQKIHIQSISWHHSRKQRARDLDLSKHQQLRRLIMINVPFISRVELKTPNLLECCIDVKFAGCLEPAQHLIRLTCQDSIAFTQSPNTTTDSSKIFTEILPTLTMLTYLEIRNIAFGESELFLSPEMKNLTIVLISQSSMTNEAFRRFVDRIPDTRDVLNVDMDQVSIIPDGAANQCVEYIKSCARFAVTWPAHSNTYLSITFHTVATGNQ